MTRLDPGYPEVQEIFGITNFNPDDPGATGTIDICLDCYFDLVNDGMPEDAGGCDHPSYDDGPPFITYRCQRCGCTLTNKDDWP